jgi:hypothetical protein
MDQQDFLKSIARMKEQISSFANTSDVSDNSSGTFKQNSSTGLLGNTSTDLVDDFHEDWRTKDLRSASPTTDADDNVTFVPANYNTANYDYSHGGFPYGRTPEIQHYQTYQDASTRGMLEWCIKYCSLGFPQEVAGLFAARHLCCDWEQEPDTDTVSIGDQISSYYTRKNSDPVIDDPQSPESPYDISSDCLIRWVNRYMCSGFEGIPAVLMVVRHLRNDWNSVHELETELIREELITLFEDHTGIYIGV